MGMANVTHYIRLLATSILAVWAGEGLAIGMGAEVLFQIAFRIEARFADGALQRLLPIV